MNRRKRGRTYSGRHRNRGASGRERRAWIVKTWCKLAFIAAGILVLIYAPERGYATHAVTGNTVQESGAEKPEGADAGTDKDSTGATAGADGGETESGGSLADIVINIRKPDGWFKESATVAFVISDAAHTGTFEVAKVQAKMGQGGKWEDVTDAREFTIHENGTVYVLVTDQYGRTYEKSREIVCFDVTAPVFNAAVYGVVLSIQTWDGESGTKSVNVNGYEFTNLDDGDLDIRLQQFDAGYEYFKIYATDNAGNQSEVYKVKNPYYKDASDSGGRDPAEQLPVSAEPTKPGSATASVTEHYRESGAESESQGKDFYTIKTAGDKVFYLIVDNDGKEETVYFLTEITENDLLNVTSDNKDVLPKNSAALDSAIPAGGALPDVGTIGESGSGQETEEPTEADTEEAGESTEAGTEESRPEEVKKPGGSANSYILIAVAAAVVIVGAYYFKIVRKKKDDFAEDEDDEDEDDEDEDDEDDEDDEGDPEYGDGEMTGGTKA